MTKENKVQLIKLLVESLELPENMKGVGEDGWGRFVSKAEFFNKITIIRKLLSELNYNEPNKKEISVNRYSETQKGLTPIELLSLVKLSARSLQGEEKYISREAGCGLAYNKTEIRNLRKKLLEFDNYKIGRY